MKATSTIIDVVDIPESKKRVTLKFNSPCVSLTKCKNMRAVYLLHTRNSCSTCVAMTYHPLKLNCVFTVHPENTAEGVLGSQCTCYV